MPPKSDFNSCDDHLVRGDVLMFVPDEGERRHTGPQQDREHPTGGDREVTDGTSA